MLRKYNKSTGGFTLIELLVVIAIIGILSSVVLASLNSARESSRDARRLSDVRQYQLALELYFDDNSSSYPASLSDLAPDYMSGTSTDPQGNSYGYTASGSPATDYILGITLEDTGHSALDNDLDTGSAGALDCSSAGVYCVAP